MTDNQPAPEHGHVPLTDADYESAELLREDELAIASGLHDDPTYSDIELLRSRLREARAELEQTQANLHDAEGRYEACYAELTKVQERNKELVTALNYIAQRPLMSGIDIRAYVDTVLLRFRSQP